MLAGSRLTDFTNLLSLYDFKKNDDIILTYFKGGQNWETKFVRTNQISIRSDNWHWKLLPPRIWPKKLCCEKLGKFTNTLDYIDKVLVVLSATSDEILL